MKIESSTPNLLKHESTIIGWRKSCQCWWRRNFPDTCSNRNSGPTLFSRLVVSCFVDSTTHRNLFASALWSDRVDDANGLFRLSSPSASWMIPCICDNVSDAFSIARVLTFANPSDSGRTIAKTFISTQKCNDMIAWKAHQRRKWTQNVTSPQ